MKKKSFPKVAEYHSLLQKVELVIIYDYLKEQISLIEATRLQEKESSLVKGEIYDSMDRVSQRSLSIELKGENNPNWLNNVFKQYKDLSLSNYLRIIRLIQSKFEELFMPEEYTFEIEIAKRTSEFTNLINELTIAYSDTNFSLEAFLAEYSEELNDQLYNHLSELLESSSLPPAEVSIAHTILNSLGSDYSEREQYE